MKKSLLVIALLLLPSIAFAVTPPQTVPSGGTGWGAIKSSTLLYGAGTTRLATTSTTTLTATSPLSLSNPVAKVGGSNSVLTIDTSGAWTGNAGTATALAANGTNCSAGNYPLGVDASGNAESCTAAASGGSGVWPFTTSDTNYGVAVQSTSTPEWFKNGLFASSTSQIAYASTTALSATTLYGALVGNASSATALFANGANCSAGNAPLGVDASGVVEGCFDVWTQAENTAAAYIATVTADSPLSGSGTSASHLTITAADATHNGYLASLDYSLLHTATTTFTAPLTYTLGTNAVTCATATKSVFGCLAAADFNTFNVNRLSTSSVLTQGNLLYTGSGGNTVSDVATGTVSGAGGVTVTAGRSAVGGALTITCTGASVSATGCLANTDFQTFNNKIGTSSALTNGQLLVAGPNGNTAYPVATSSPTFNGGLTTSGTAGSWVGGSSYTVSISAPVSIANGGTNATSFTTSGNTVYWDGTRLATALTTASATTPYASSTAITASGRVYSLGNIVPTFKSPGFTISTTTAWTATTTQSEGQLPSPFTAETIQSVQCYTDVGTLNVDIYHTSTHLKLFNASTTQGVITFSANNTMTVGEKWYIQSGTPATAPTSITCAFKLLITSD